MTRRGYVFVVRLKLCHVGRRLCFLRSFIRDNIVNVLLCWAMCIMVFFSKTGFAECTIKFTHFTRCRQLTEVVGHFDKWLNRAWGGNRRTCYCTLVFITWMKPSISTCVLLGGGATIELFLCMIEFRSAPSEARIVFQHDGEAKF